VPGVGKSTFIESFGKLLLAQGKRLAVLAVDPSSPLAGGSIMGDKTRMETLSREPDAFIRPSPSGGALGGVAQKTRESMLLCEAAGFDVVVVETVGVGAVGIPGRGDGGFLHAADAAREAATNCRASRSGILELAHALVINKSDGDGEHLARVTQGQYQSALEPAAR
jgi:LAO/AO transport system kinase